MADGYWDLDGVEVPAGGVLTDRELKVLAQERAIVTRGNGSINADQACVDVHMADDVFKLGESLTDQVPRETDGSFHIRPGQVLRLTTQETFKLPADVQGQVSPKAWMTTLGLFFPTTHVDPGYDDRLYLPVMNAGPHVVMLEPGRAIGKVELQRLGSDVGNAWKGKSSFFENPAFKWVVSTPPNADEESAAIRRTLAWHRLWLVVVLVIALAGVTREAIGSLVASVDFEHPIAAGVVLASVGILLGGFIAWVTGIVGLLTRDLRKR
jgi:deoxycytidine triphosphate deaminase